MASLSLFDEHVAWQKRVNKEIFQAHKLNQRFRGQTPKLILRVQLSRLPTPLEAEPVIVKRQPNRIFAEVRGKYARPDRTFNPAFLPAIFDRNMTGTSGRRTHSLTFKVAEQDERENFERVEEGEFGGIGIGIGNEEGRGERNLGFGIGNDERKRIRQEKLRKLVALREERKKALRLSESLDQGGSENCIKV